MSTQTLSEALERFNNKMNERGKVVFNQCIQQILKELDILQLRTRRNLPIFEYKIINNLIETAIKRLKCTMNDYSINKMQNNDQKGDIKNYSDGLYEQEGDFFASFIKLMDTYIDRVCDVIDIENRSLRHEICRFIKLKCILTLLNCKYKLHVRCGYSLILPPATLTRYNDLHKKLEKICPELRVTQFISYRKHKMKQNNKRSIPSKEFHQHLIEFVEYLFYQQQQIVYGVLKLNIINNNIKINVDDALIYFGLKPDDLYLNAYCKDIEPQNISIYNICDPCNIYDNISSFKCVDCVNEGFYESQRYLLLLHTNKRLKAEMKTLQKQIYNGQNH